MDHDAFAIVGSLSAIRSAGGGGALTIISSAQERGPADAPGAPAPRFVCILGLGRTGTNHLTSVLSAVPEIDSRREIFSPRRSYRLHRQELEGLSRRTGRSFPPSSADPKAVRTIRRQPGLVLDCLSSLMPPSKRLLVFKVIMPQLRVRQVGRAIIGRPDTIIVFHRRRPIDVFISRAKAARLQTWMKVDTTDLKVEIDAAEFLSWWRDADLWYQRLEAECWLRNKQVHHMTYEDDIECGSLEMVRRFCAILAQHGITGLTIPDEDPMRGLQRQDRNEDPADRVSNWPEFQNRLAAMGCLEKAFAPFPHFQPGAWDRFRYRLLSRMRSPLALAAPSTHVS